MSFDWQLLMLSQSLVPVLHGGLVLLVLVHLGRVELRLLGLLLHLLHYLSRDLFNHMSIL